MIRLTYSEPNGNWGIIGMNAENQDQKMYMVAAKLKDYEETGLSPDEVEKVNDFADSQLAKVLAELQQYKRKYGESVE